MAINIQDNILKLHALGLLDKLLIDKTTKKNILWATSTYSKLGTGYGRDEQITSDLITGKNAGTIKTRAQKAMEQQSERTRQHAEVFSPFWVCQEMTNYADEMWSETGTDWNKYVNSRQMEITCGEAPYLVSRYDVETGEAVPISERIGLLDRKLKAVNDHTQSEKEWLKWSIRAYRATYGYDYQGDNVLISRVNLLMTFEDYLWERWKRKPTIAEYKKLIAVITWNLWQMDGLTGAVPCGSAEDEQCQISFFDLLGGTTGSTVKTLRPRCLVHNWKSGDSVEFLALPTRGKQAMKFDFIIGNPPYQDETLGENKGFAPPIYHKFLENAYQIADVVELIHPARFLFNAGSTPKQWNKQMLEDPHLKVLHYEQDASKVFRNTEIKGGIAVTYHDKYKNFGTIGIFTAYSELNDILQKVHRYPNFEELSSIAVTSYAYHFTEKMHMDYPNAVNQLSAGHANDLKSNVFERLPQVFWDSLPEDGENYVQILGREGNERAYKYINSGYINKVKNLYKYKIYIPKANGAGTLGEVLSPPVLAGPGVGATETFLSIGAFETEDEAKALLKYIKTKFARILLGVLKTTQDITPQKWANVPLQNFTATSDINWSKSVQEIDQQLYNKYGLDEQEIEFIERRAKEME